MLSTSFALLESGLPHHRLGLTLFALHAVSTEDAMKEVCASAPVEEADIDAELAAGTDEPDLEEEDAAGDMGGDNFELPEPYAEYEAQHSQASIQHSSGQALLHFFKHDAHQRNAQTHRHNASVLAQAVCMWESSQD